jgi:hypothetical protein
MHAFGDITAIMAARGKYSRDRVARDYPPRCHADFDLAAKSDFHPMKIP